MSFNAVFGGIGRALAVPAYRSYFIGNLISTIGRWAYRLGLGWLVWDLTKSEAWLGIVAFTDLFPSMVVPVFAGVITDRVGIIPVIRVTVAVGAVVATAFVVLTVSDAVTVEAVVGLSALIGIVEAFAGPARISIAHTLVPRAVSSSAIAMNLASFNASRLVGPAIAGPIILVSGVSTVFALNAIGYCLFLILMLRLDVGISERSAAPRRHMAAEIWEAMRAIWHDRGIRFLLILLTATGLLIRPVIEFLPGFAAQVFAGGPGALSLLLSTLGFGGMLASLWLARRGELAGLTRIVVGAYLAMALSLVAFSLINSLWFGVVSIAALGFFLIIGNIGAQSLVQSVVSGHLRARVISLYMIGAFGSPALGALLEGWVATFVGLQITVAVGGALAALVWLWARRLAAEVAPELER